MLELIAHGLFDSNCYLLSDDDSNAIVIDPGMDNPKALSAILKHKGVNLRAVLNTHAHFDHTAGNAGLVSTSIDLALHPADADLLARNGGATMFGMDLPQSPVPTIKLSDGQVLEYGSLLIQVIYTPGHTPGCVCFYLPDEHLLISGDTLFLHSVGRTDLPGGNQRQLGASLKRLFQLPGETKVYPGHGPATTIEEERLHNPFRHMA